MARNRILQAVRDYFAANGFVEVSCAALQLTPGNEAHLHGFETTRIMPDGLSHRVYLHTSPEFACKKLLAAGEPRIFDLAHVFRNREAGPLHAPEFMMLEWYRAHAAYETVMADCAALLRCAAAAVNCEVFTFRERASRPHLTPERLTVADAFSRYAGIDLLATLHADGRPDAAKFRHSAAAAGVRVAADDTWSDVFSRVLTERVEFHLGLGRPTLLYEYPRVEAALARPAPHDPRVAERFELYVCGVEIANGFGELRDAAEQRARFTREMDEKERVYGERYPIDEDLLQALPLMPEASGVALGFDRLVMVATGAQRIEQVQWTPSA